MVANNGNSGPPAPDLQNFISEQFDVASKHAQELREVQVDQQRATMVHIWARARWWVYLSWTTMLLGLALSLRLLGIHF